MWITEIDGDPVDAGIQVVPLGLCLHADVAEARPAQEPRPVDPQSGRQPSVVCDLRICDECLDLCEEILN